MSSRDHVRSRAGVLVAGAFIAVCWAAAPRPTRPDEESVARMLGASVGGSVGAEDFVWEPSSGTFADLLKGRGVVFLARVGEGAVRDAYRARVLVLPSGRPLSVRSAHALTRTSQGDEEGLVVGGGVAVFATRFQDRDQSITVVDLESERGLRRVLLPEPLEKVALEVRAGELLVDAGTGSATALELSSSQVVAGMPLRMVHQSDATVADSGSPIATIEHLDAAIETWPPTGYSAEVVFEQRPEPAIFSREDGDLHVVLLDGRQLDFAMQLGSDGPPTATGFVSSGAVPEAVRARELVFAAEIVTARRFDAGGAFDRNGWLAPMRPNLVTVAATPEGELSIGAWSGGAWERSSWPAAVQWTGDASRGGSHALCVTRGGHLAIAWSSQPAAERTTDALPKGCVAMVAGLGTLELVEAGAGLGLFEHSAAPLILASCHDYAPPVRLPKGAEWRASQGGQPTPEFLPAMHETTIDTLGTTVTVRHIDPRRFDWSLVAGRSERAHRMGGEFPKSLPPADRPRARFALGLAYAKRKAPRGLRIGGSTGLEFSRDAAVLTARNGALALVDGATAQLEAAPDATELPFTAVDRALAAAARERGPRQLRADLCVLDDGGLLVAETVFDSHEATATVLLQLGCERTAALDRGTEQPSLTRLDAAAAEAADSTMLVGLDAPLRGRVLNKSSGIQR